MTNPNPAIGAVKSDASKLASKPSSLMVVYRYLDSSASHPKQANSKVKKEEERRFGDQDGGSLE